MKLGVHVQLIVNDLKNARFGHKSKAMTELDLYKFIQQNDIEYRWQDNNGLRDVMVWIYIIDLSIFHDLINFDYSESGIDCTLVQEHVCFWMDDICKYHDVDMKKVFGEDPIMEQVKESLSN